jgi:hypothetical protein
MKPVTITTNDDHYLLDDGKSVRSRAETTIKIISQPSGVTLTLGCDDGEGNFSAWTNGTFTGDTTLKHGVGAKLMIRSAGITDDPVKLLVSE